MYIKVSLIDEIEEIDCFTISKKSSTKLYMDTYKYLNNLNLTD